MMNQTYLDVFSRKILGFEVHDSDSADHAAHLVKRTALAEGIHAMPHMPVLHGNQRARVSVVNPRAKLILR